MYATEQREGHDMNARNVPIDVLRATLAYDPAAGTFTRYRASARAKAGSNAVMSQGNRPGHPYLCVFIGGRVISAARAAIAWMTGAWHVGQLQFLDGDGTNLRWSNIAFNTKPYGSRCLDFDTAAAAFRLDAETGYLYRTAARKGVHAPNVPVGSPDQRGYLHVAFRGSRYKVHRIAWLLTHRAWPIGELDHIDGNPANNRPSNLREASRQLNAENRRKATHSSMSGVLGASPHGRGFMAQIVSQRTHYYLGTFDTAEEAHQAYVDAKRKLHAGCTL